MMRRHVPVIAHLMLQSALTGVAHAVYAPPVPFDAARWTVKKSVTASFGARLPNTTVSLLTSKKPTGTDPEEPIYTANVIVAVGDTVVYRFLQGPLATHGGYDHECDTNFMDDILELKDVTGDSVPEILFHTGCGFADDFKRVFHVLQFVGTTSHRAAFRDIHLPEFTESHYRRVGWLTYAGHHLIIVADEQDREFTEPEEWCYQCGRYHNYRVYEWDRSRRRMMLRATIPHTKEIHGDEDPFSEDRAYILGHLRRLYGARRTQNASAIADRWPVHVDFDPSQWDISKTLTVSFGPTLPRATVQLLVSKEAVTRSELADGTLVEEYRMVNVVVHADGRAIYQYCWLPLAYHARREGEDFFQGADIELRDVTNDGIPEVLFHSRDYVSSHEFHVLRYDPRATAVEAFTDIVLRDAWWKQQYPSWEKFSWLQVGGRTAAVVAVPRSKDDFYDSPVAYHYDVYEWNSGQEAFTLSGTIASTGQLLDRATDPFSIDGEYLKAELARLHRPISASP